MGNQTNKNVVFFAPFGLWTVHNGLDAFLSNVLYLRGFNPSVLICDGLFNQCLLHNNGNKKDICNICFNENKNLFNSDHKNIFKLSSYFRLLRIFLLKCCFIHTNEYAIIQGK